MRNELSQSIQLTFSTILRKYIPCLENNLKLVDNRTQNPCYQKDTHTFTTVK